MTAMTVGAASRNSDGRARLSLHSGVRPRMAPVAQGQYPTPLPVIAPGAVQSVFSARSGRVSRRVSGREPQRDLALGRLWRVGPVHEVVLGLQREVTADRARDGRLDRVGAPGDLPEIGRAS